MSGDALEVRDPAEQARVAVAAAYEPEDRYVLFELFESEARCHGYGDVPLPEPRRWSEIAPG